jgi:DNA-binding NtrC family response regulator
MADVRVMASSDRDLSRAVIEGRFREGLLFHLNGVCLTLCPLRQRRAELRELSEFFVRRYANHYNKPPVTLSHDTIRLFSEYHWPGNLQELDTVVKRIVLLGSEASAREELTRAVLEPAARSVQEWRTRPGASDSVASPVLPLGPDVTGAPRMPLKEIARQAADDAERSLIYRTLQRTRWNRREAAARLGVSYKALLHKIKRAETSGAM